MSELRVGENSARLFENRAGHGLVAFLWNQLSRIVGRELIDEKEIGHGDNVAQSLDALAKKGREPVFKASAVKGDGVLESFFGLLHLTWSKLDAEHQLAKKLGLDSAQFLTHAARKLGFEGNVDDLLRACVGGSLDYTAPVTAVRS